jgi:hypothetical protein
MGCNLGLDKDTSERWRYLLANDHGGTKKKVVDIIRKDGVNHSGAIQVSQFGFGFSRGLSKPFCQETSYKDMYHSRLSTRTQTPLLFSSYRS